MQNRVWIRSYLRLDVRDEERNDSDRERYTSQMFVTVPKTASVSTEHKIYKFIRFGIHCRSGNLRKQPNYNGVFAGSSREEICMYSKQRVCLLS